MIFYQKIEKIFYLTNRMFCDIMDGALTDKARRLPATNSIITFFQQIVNSKIAQIFSRNFVHVANRLFALAML